MIKKIEEQYQHRYKELAGFIRKQLLQDIYHINEEDIIQEVFLSLLSGVNALRPIENVVGYIYGSIRNEISDVLRKKKTVSNYLNTYYEDDTDEDHYEGDDEELISMLNSEIAELPEEQQIVIKATLFEGLTFKELSEKTGISINTLLGRKRYAIKTLKEKLIKKGGKNYV